MSWLDSETTIKEKAAIVQRRSWQVGGECTGR